MVSSALAGKSPVCRQYWPRVCQRRRQLALSRLSRPANQRRIDLAPTGLYRDARGGGECIMTTKKGVDQRQSNMWSGEEQPERGVIRRLPKKQKRGQQQTQESAESERWWRNATRFAENAWYGETAYLSPK